MITCMKMKSFILKYASKIIFYDVNIACYQYAQQYGVETFFTMTRFESIRLLLSIAP